MAFTPLWGTGFEMGNEDIFSSVNSAQLVTDAADVHTGTYGVQLRDGQVNVNVGGNEVYISFWMRMDWDSPSDMDFRILYDNSNYVVKLLFSSTGTIKAYRHTGEIDSVTSTINFQDQDWHRISIYTMVDNSGYIQVKVDDVLQLDFSGDTYVSGGSIINGFKGGSNNAGWVEDDFVLGTGGWPEDYRVEAVFPDSDVTTEWDIVPSGTSDHYSVLDDTSDISSNYVYTSVSGESERFSLDSWTKTNRDLKFVIHWVKAYKDVADSSSINLKAHLGGSTDTENKDLPTSAAYLYQVLATAPGGGAWGNDDLDGGAGDLEVEFEAVLE